MPVSNNAQTCSLGCVTLVQIRVEIGQGYNLDGTPRGSHEKGKVHSVGDISDKKMRGI